MRGVAVSIWLQISILLVLSIAGKSPWIAFRGSSIEVVFAIDVPLELKKGVVVAEEDGFELLDVNPLDPRFQVTLQKKKHYPIRTRDHWQERDELGTNLGFDKFSYWPAVCDGDYGARSGGSRIHLEIEGLGRSRFEFEAEGELKVKEKAVNQLGRKSADQQDGMDPETDALMKTRLARSEELAFMPSELYMSYEGYSHVMLQSSTLDEIVRLYRKKTLNGGSYKDVPKKKAEQGDNKSTKI